MAGLDLVFTQQRINRVKGDPALSKTNEQRFKDHYGASHFVAANIWEDLQRTNIPEARVSSKTLSIDYFLEALNFLYRYKRESERESTFDKSPKTLRKWCWYYLEKIQALKNEKIVFPADFKETDVWIMTVDGTHALINEPIHSVFSQDSKFFSHKKKHAGLSYELGIHLFESKLIWMNGPYPAGLNDKSIFANGGLKAKLAAIGKKALGDKGYTGHPKECSTFNAQDCDAVKNLKSRAQMRHEQFNGMLKEFSCLDDRFRHLGEPEEENGVRSYKKFKTCFECCAVICQYRMEHGEPLFDVLAGIRLQDEEEINHNEE